MADPSRAAPPARARTGAVLEAARILAIVAAGLALASVFLRSGPVGSGDAYWYHGMVADFVAQWRAGSFPVFVGQSEFAFNGATSPVRLAPYFQHLAGILDLATGRTLGIWTLQNLMLALSVGGGGLSAYAAGRAIRRDRPWIALGFALLYMGSPAAMALLYTGNLFMSVSSLPWLPLAVLGLWRWWEGREGLAAAAGMALPLAAVWWCHPPIALWMTLCVGAGGMARLVRGGRSRQAWSTAAAAAALFALAAGYVFVSVLTLRTPPTPPVNPASFVGSVEDSFPACLLPVSRGADLMSDYQLGWGLWLAGLLAAAATLRRPRRGTAAALACLAALLFFLLPVPFVDRWLWRHAVPQFVANITLAWAAQRLAIVAATLALVAGLGGAAALATSPFRRAALGGLLVLALGWTAHEDLKFIRRGRLMVPSAENAARVEGAQNIVLTRYSFNSFLPVPGYFSHGYMDPYLASRVLSADGRTVLADNQAAARPPDSAPSVPLTAAYDPVYRQAGLEPALTLAPGVRYAVRIQWHAPAAAAILSAEGRRVGRMYVLPDSAGGMIQRVPTRAFGSSPSNTDFFPLWSPVADTVRLKYGLLDPAAPPVPADFGRLYVRPYAVDRLPIRVTSWIPFRAETAAPAAGGWLETPRLWIPGYAAQVNGRPAKLRETADGLVGVALQPGENRVVLTYPGPWFLRAAYAVSLLTWAAAGITLGALAFGRRRSAAQPSPAR